MSLRTDRRRIAVGAASRAVCYSYVALLAPLVGPIAASLDASVGAVGAAVGAQAAVVAVGRPLAERARRARPPGFDRLRGVSAAAWPLLAASGAALTAVAPGYRWLLAAQIVGGVGVARGLAAPPARAAGDGPQLSVVARSAGLALPFAVVAAVTAVGGGWRIAVGALALPGIALAALGVPVDADRDARDRGRRRGRFRSSGTEGAGLRGRLRRAAVELTRPRTARTFCLGLFAAASAWGVRTYLHLLLRRGYGFSTAEAAALVATTLVCGGAAALLWRSVGSRVGERIASVGAYLAVSTLGLGLAASVPRSAATGMAVALLVAVGAVVAVGPSDGATRTAVTIDDGSALPALVGASAGWALAAPAFGLLVDVRGVGAVFGVVASVGLLAAGVATWSVEQRADAGSAPRAGD